jgi:hypothetical protein
METYTPLAQREHPREGHSEFIVARCFRPGWYWRTDFTLLGCRGKVQSATIVNGRATNVNWIAVGVRIVQILRGAKDHGESSPARPID